MSNEPQQNPSVQNDEVNHIVPVTDEAWYAAFVMYSWLESCWDEFQAAYELHRHDIGGYIGMSDLAAQAACIFIHEAGSLVAGEDYIWYDAIEAFAGEVIRHLARASLDRAGMHSLAAQNIEKYRE